jgi:hypothetical protein
MTTDPLFAVTINDKGEMNVVVRKDFWEQDDKDVLFAVVTIATFVLSANDSVLEAKQRFIDACSDAVDLGSEDVVPSELIELRKSLFDFDDIPDFIHPSSKGIH